jgi:hypothetical protein
MITQAARFQHMARRGKGIGDNDLGTGGYVCLVRLTNGVGVGEYGATTPDLTIHGHTRLFQQRAHTSIDDNRLAGAI